MGEWDMRGTDQAARNRLQEWYDYAVNSASYGQGARVVGLSAFDSGLNSPNGSWVLKTQSTIPIGVVETQTTLRNPKFPLTH